MARRTHRMRAKNPNASNFSNLAQGISITSPSLKRFPAFEDSLPSTTIADVKTGADFIDTSLTSDVAIGAGGDSYSMNVGSTTGNVGVSPANWAAPGNNDWLFFAVIRAIEDPSNPGSGYACYIDIDGLGVFPYMMRFENISSGGVNRPVYTKDLSGNWNYQFNGVEDPGYPVTGFGGWWCDNCQGWNLVDGQVYSIGGAKRGDWMEHYFDNKLVGKINVEDFAQTYGFDTNRWRNWTPPAGLETSHSGWSGVGCNKDEVVHTIGHYPSDYYGMLQHVFSDGLPNDIEEAMQWMKEQWTAGNKVIWPGWVTLK